MKLKRFVALLLALLTAAALLLTSCIKVVINTDGKNKETNAPATEEMTGEDFTVIPEAVSLLGITVSLGENNYATRAFPCDENCIGAVIRQYQDDADTEKYLPVLGSSSDDIGANLTASVTGTTEVPVRVSVECGADNYVLPAGSYTDYTELVLNDDGEYGYFKQFELSKPYDPLIWYLKINYCGEEYDLNSLLFSLLDDDILSELNKGQITQYSTVFGVLHAISLFAGEDMCGEIVGEALEKAIPEGSNFRFEPGYKYASFRISYDLDENAYSDVSFSLVWDWPLQRKEIAVIDVYDRADTLLGNMLAGVADPPEGSVAPGPGFDIYSSVSVTVSRAGQS